MKLVWGIPLLVIALAACIKGEDFSSVVLSESHGFILKWWFDGDEIVIQASYAGQGWIGIGWHCPSSEDSPWCSDTDSGMTNLDAIIGVYDDSGSLVSATDRYSLNVGSPSIDGSSSRGCTDDLIQYSGYQTSFLTFLEFRRKLVTNDTQCDHPIVKGEMSFVWAHGNPVKSPNTFGYHGNPNRGSSKVNLDTGKTSKPVDYAAWHGAIMLISWSISISFGVFTARFLKAFTWWFPLHIFTQVFGLLGMLSAFGLAIYMSHGLHFKSVHSWFGLSVIVLGMVGAVLGVLSHVMWDPKRLGIPVWPDKLHWYVGRLAVALSYVTILLGMRLYGLPNVMIVAFSIVVALYLVIYAFVSVSARREKVLQLQWQH